MFRVFSGVLGFRIEGFGVEGLGLRVYVFSVLGSRVGALGLAGGLGWRLRVLELGFAF